MTQKRIQKASLTKPKSGAGKGYDHDYSFVFDKDKPEPKYKRVLTEVEKLFWNP